MPIAALRVHSDSLRLRAGLCAWAVCLASMSWGCAPEPGRDPRPSILLVVLDTVRADAVSAYGHVTGTTPALDRLAQGGLLYSNARSTSSWTLPAHASLFTGLGFERHRVGTAGRISLAREATTLAEQLRDAGYRTAGFSENMLVSPTFDLLQGFTVARAVRFEKLDRGNGVTLDVRVGVDIARDVAAWLTAPPAAGEPGLEAPLFVFANVYDAHAPYEIRDVNPWVPEDTTDRQLARRREEPEKSLCSDLPFADEIAIQHGLYLGDVHAADAKLAQLLATLTAADPTRRWIVVVTSDHGELLGEHRLFGHEFSLAEETQHVPLVVHGLPDVAPGVIDLPVSLIDVMPSILAWTNTPAALPLQGRPLPTDPEAVPDARPFFAGYADDYVIESGRFDDLVGFTSKGTARNGCRSGEPVFGPMATLVDPPFKLHWYRDYPPRLYDLSWDPEERSDQSDIQPRRLEALLASLTPLVDEAGLDAPRTGPPAGAAPTPEHLEALKALGYLDEEAGADE